MKKELTEGQMNTVVNEFNKFMEERNIPRLKQLTDKRRELIQTIWQEFSWEDMQKVFRNAAYSPFLNGQTKKKFLATFEWIMEKANFLRILEGTFNL